MHALSTGGPGASFRHRRLHLSRECDLAQAGNMLRDSDWEEKSQSE